MSTFCFPSFSICNCSSVLRYSHLFSKKFRHHRPRGNVITDTTNRYGPIITVGGDFSHTLRGDQIEFPYSNNGLAIVLYKFLKKHSHETQAMSLSMFTIKLVISFFAFSHLATVKKGTGKMRSCLH